MSQRTVFCQKLQTEAPGLEVPPFEGPLGQQIFESVSAEAWAYWTDSVMIKVINEYRLNMADPADYQRLLEQMSAFLNLADSAEPLELENEERGKSGS
jgi:Fe-S cluster biosynthesis and repair protein YggX